MAGTFGNYVVWDSRKLAAGLRGPDGPVLRDMLKGAERVKTRAKELAGVHHPHVNERRSRRPGTLRDSIVKRVVTKGDGFVIQVGSEDPIALWHHEGTVPHVIRARNAPYLVFYWPKVGRIVRFKQVNHPGTKPNRFLTKALTAYR